MSGGGIMGVLFKHRLMRDGLLWDDKGFEWSFAAAMVTHTKMTNM